MIIRPEKPKDVQKIRHIHVQAFDTEAEANLVDAIRNSDISIISLIAEEKGELIGHILFSTVTLGDDTSTSIAGLAPIAVAPERQKKGIGSLLVEEGLKRCKEAGYAAVVVLGHPEYYPRFGFVPSVRYGISSEYDVPNEVFMIKELENGALNGYAGIIKYHKTFNAL